MADNMTRLEQIVATLARQVLDGHEQQIDAQDRHRGASDFHPRRRSPR